MGYGMKIKKFISSAYLRPPDNPVPYGLNANMLNRVLWRLTYRRLKGSFTIEAAIVMPIVFIVIVEMIKADIRLHDIAVGNFAANEAAEIYGIRDGRMTADEVEEYENERLNGLFSGEEYVISITENGDGSSVSIKGENMLRTYTDKGYRPENWMRKLTILEEALDSE